MLPKLLPLTKAEERANYATATNRDNDTCQRCLRNCGPTARDHRKNRSQGGRTTPANLQVLGLGCHDWKTHHPKLAMDDGWSCPSWAEPDQWPARRWLLTPLGARRLAWVLYDDEGGFREIPENEAMERMGRV